MVGSVIRDEATVVDESKSTVGNHMRVQVPASASQSQAYSRVFPHASRVMMAAKVDSAAIMMTFW
jgi:hypothetical protein